MGATSITAASSMMKAIDSVTAQIKSMKKTLTGMSLRDKYLFLTILITKKHYKRP